mmetsp:Transcript_38197/g.83238  ORF Transcript_38197/g.83238 Transcript_38197/m.83238 type:complete len:91 (+) Transcript_38197:833-1105(+)
MTDKSESNENMVWKKVDINIGRLTKLDLVNDQSFIRNSGCMFYSVAEIQLKVYMVGKQVFEKFLDNNIIRRWVECRHHKWVEGDDVIRKH